MKVTSMPTNACLPRETLKEYLSGWTDTQHSDAIEAHLLHCGNCEQTLAMLESDPDTLCEFVRAGAMTSQISSHASSHASGQMPSHASSQMPSQISGQSSDGAEDAGDTPQHPAVDYAIEKVSRLPEWSRIEEASLAQELPGAAESPWLPSTTQIGPYELLRPLGAGGMGSVYLARHQQLGKLVAIKLLPTRPFRNDHYAARFQREVRAAGQLEHPAIVSATDAGEHAATHYLVMEYIDGFDLSQVARQFGQLAVADACAILQSVALGLSHAHAAGIVHRDIKPSNVMLGRMGEVKILDFGLAQVSLWDEVSAELTTVGQLMGTLDYMAPEQAEHADSVDYRADLYSLGATLFRLLCGRAPLAAAPDMSPLAKLRLLGTHTPPHLLTLRPDAPKELAEVVASLLARDPAQRPPSAAHVAELLQPFTAGADLKQLITTVRSRTHAPDSLPNSTAAPAIAVNPALGGNQTIHWTRWLVAAAFAPLLLLAGIVITLEWQKGELVIESSIANVEVKLLREGELYEKLTIQPGTNKTRLYAGRYEVVVDAASDGFEIDNDQIQITRGGTVIARVSSSPPSSSINDGSTAGNSVAPGGMRPTMNTNNSVAPGGMRPTQLPSSSSPFTPGEVLKVQSLTDPNSINTKVMVMADRTIKLPLVGVVDVSQGGLIELESRLNDRYLPFIKTPAIEVFRDFETTLGSQVQRSLPLMDSAEVSDNSNKIESSRPELLFNGKPLSAWLIELARERNREALGECVAAIEALATQETGPQITAALLESMPKMGDREVILPNAQNQFPSKSDLRLFPLLASLQSDGRAFFSLLVSELEKGNRSWSGRILHPSNWNIVATATVDAEPLLDWLDKNVFEAEHEHELLLNAAKLLRNLIESEDNRFSDSPLKPRMIASLVGCERLGADYWLAWAPHKRSDMNSRGGLRFAAWEPEIIQKVESLALATLASPAAIELHVVQAAKQLVILNAPTYDRGGLPSPQVSPESIAFWLHQFSENKVAGVIPLVELHWHFALLPDASKQKRIEGVSVYFSQPMRNGCIPIEMLSLARQFDIDSSHFASELNELVDSIRSDALQAVAKTGSQELYFDPNTLQSTFRGVAVAPEFNTVRRKPTANECLAFLILSEAIEFLPAETQQALQQAIQQEVQRTADPASRK